MQKNGSILDYLFKCLWFEINSLHMRDLEDFAFLTDKTRRVPGGGAQVPRGCTQCREVDYFITHTGHLAQSLFFLQKNQLNTCPLDIACKKTSAIFYAPLRPFTQPAHTKQEVCVLIGPDKR